MSDQFNEIQPPVEHPPGRGRNGILLMDSFGDVSHSMQVSGQCSGNVLPVSLDFASLVIVLNSHLLE